MLEELLFYLHGFQRYEFYFIMLFYSEVQFRETGMQEIEILSSACVFNLTFLGITKAKRANEAILRKLNA